MSAADTTNSATDTLHTEAEQVATTSTTSEAHKIPNSPTSAFARLSLSSTSPTSSHFTPTHLAELESSTALVNALDSARNQPKPLIRSTGHHVPIPNNAGEYHHLLSWKVAEFAYRKSTSIDSELPTLARGLFTERITDSSSSDSKPKHRIVVRGYDKFFNLGELSWTKPDSIRHFTTPPYVLTFKENGCIIFVAALSPTQVVVTSKHSLGGIEGTETTHAEKGREWLLKHLSSVNKTEEQLAEELWGRNETAAFELCDDSFEEHVLPYSQDRSGLHLHGLNSNSAKFSTRSMPEVDAFAKEWGFIPTRWIQLSSLEEVQKVTGEIEQTGAWDGEPIEGFVIRTHMPGPQELEKLKRDLEGKVVSPPYDAGQAWFYKVKFDEPYLMYRDWRELARKMVKGKREFDAKAASLSSTPSTSLFTGSTSEPTPTPAPVLAVREDGETPSKAALKRARKAESKLASRNAAASRAAAQAAGLLPPPPPPQPRSKRPETLLFIEWCYDRLYGNEAKRVKAQPGLFAPLERNKGIIAMRDAFLAYLSTHPSFSSSTTLATQGKGGDGKEEEDKREITKTILTPIAVPGCGKTIMAIALKELFSVGHVQSDDYKAKKGFLSAIEKDLRSHAAERNYVLFADKNNHLLEHRDEIVSLCRQLSQPQSPPPPAAQGKKKQPPEVGRIRTIALAWDLDTLPLNTLHRLCTERVEARGDNHQTLVADKEEGAVKGVKSHEVVLWRFLEALQPFGEAEGKGEGGEGWGDAEFDKVVKLSVRDSAKENLRRVIEQVGGVIGWKMPSDEKIEAAMENAASWKVAKKANVEKKKEKEQNQVGIGGVRYFGLAVELDVRSTLDSILSSPTSCSDGLQAVADFYRKVRQGGRLNLRPHITLVHNSNLSSSTPCSASNAEQNEADLKWQFYSSLLSSPSSPSSSTSFSELIFKISLTTLLYEHNTILTFPIDNILPPPSLEAKFWQLHSKNWTPHITIATSERVKPYQANRVVQSWLDNGKQEGENINVVNLKERIVVEARIFGMT